MALQLQCPSCSAPIDVKNKGSLFVVCNSCGTTSTRKDQDLEAYGKVSELQDDGSPFQIGSTGKYDGKKFEFLGRIQLKLPTGFWNEWYLQTEGGRGAWLSEAQGFLTFTEEQKLDEYPAANDISVGQNLTLGGHELEVKELQTAQVLSGEGELPFSFEGDYETYVVDMVDPEGNFATLDYSDDPPHFFFGKGVKFESMSFANLKDKEAALYYSRPDSGGKVQCKGCGASLDLRGGKGTKSLGCEFCGSVIDTSSKDYDVVGKIKKLQGSGVEPLVPLGHKATFKFGGIALDDEDPKEEREYEHIGFMVRAVTYDNVDYDWTEYLFMDRTGAYLWLSESDGHFNLIRALNRSVKADDTKIKFEKKKFRQFTAGKFGKTKYVVGEFYWQINTKDRPKLSDYVAPPYSLSREKTKKEITWSYGRYMEQSEAAEALGIDITKPATGVNLIQPNPHQRISKWLKRLFWGFSAALLVTAIYFQGQAKEKTVFQQNFKYNRKKVAKGGKFYAHKAKAPHYGTNPKKRALTTRQFFIPKSKKNLDVTIRVPSLRNQWSFFTVLMVPMNSPPGKCKGKPFAKAKKKKGKKGKKGKKKKFKNNVRSIAFSKEVAFYAGSDWEEGSRSENFSIPAVKRGCYYLWVDPLFDPKIKKTGWSIKMIHDSPNPGLALLCIILLTLPRVFVFFRAKAFEGRRWSESDFWDDEE